METIKKSIIVISILIIILIIFIFIFNKNINERDDKIGDVGQEVSYESDELTEVTDNIRFYTVNKCVYQYLDTINKQNSNYYGYNENGEYVSILDESEIKEKIYNLLGEEYISENKIQLNNVYEYVDDIKEKILFVPLKMKVIKKENVEKYVVYGIEQTIENKYLKDIYLVVNLDVSNQTFSIEPLKEYKDLNEIVVKNNNIRIEKNDENSYEYEKVSYEYTVKKYMDYYKKLSLAKPELIYNYMDEEYRNKRFGNLENYEKYIKNNKQELTTLQCTKYLVNNYDGYTQYVCQDKYENLYIFNERAPMDFTLKLDAYTIPTEKFTTTYNSSDNQKKVMMNVDKWVQMLNNRDYTSAYKLLDETYRDNIFGSEEQFEAVMREKLPLHYKVEYSNWSEENETYIQDITLTDITEEKEGSIQLSVIMQLKEDLDFVMSFSFKE